MSATVGSDVPTVTPAPRPRFGRTFWTLNVIEMWERLAYYNLRVMAPIYIMQADNPGGLHLTAKDKGTIYAWWAIFQAQTIMPGINTPLLTRSQTRGRMISTPSRSSRCGRLGS